MTELVNGWLLPITYIVGAGLAFIVAPRAWVVARTTVMTALLLVILSIFSAMIGFHSEQFDLLGLMMALLVAFLGWVVINYSYRYLSGEPNQVRFVRAMLSTLACVSLLVVSRHLLIIVAAWCGSSIGLHFLLTFYSRRKAAQVVAHKKFIVSRLADVCSVLAVMLVYQTVGSLSLSDINVYVQSAQLLPVTLHWAAALFALAAMLKSAQLPFNGWLIQVMEAPTPVSALLHAGVVNIGGFVLIRLATLIVAAPVAQAMLVLVGSLTAVLAGLVMMTRISIKVRLAWSTCAQMGLMLMEVGLGLYALALLHLFAHSLYKAYAFLAAGERVAEARVMDFFSVFNTRGTLLWYFGSVGLSALTVFAAIGFWQSLIHDLHLSFTASVILVFGLAPLVWFDQVRSVAVIVQGLVRIFALVHLYLLWHMLFSELAPEVVAPTLLVAWAVTVFALLYAVQVWLWKYPQGLLANRLYPWAYCGFYLDESFTRLTFKLWPPSHGCPKGS